MLTGLKIITLVSFHLTDLRSVSIARFVYFSYFFKKLGIRTDCCSGFFV